MSRDNAFHDYVILTTGCRMVKRVDAETAAELARRGIEVVFYVPEGILGRDAGSLKCIRAPAGRIRRVCGYFSLLRELQPDHVELYIGRPRMLVPLYALLAKLARCPVVVWCRGSEIARWDEYRFYVRVLTRIVAALADYLLLKEPFMYDKIVAERIAIPSKLQWMPNKIPIRSEYTLHRDSPVVLFLNSPRPMRHVELIAEAIPSVLAEVPAARFEFVGVRNRAEHAYVWSVIERVGVGDSVGVHYYQEDVNCFLEQAALFVLPAERVYLNHSLLEAMERGIPPIVADVDPSVGEVVEHGVDGLVLPLDAGTWGRAIAQLLVDESRRREMGANAREKVVRCFNLASKIDDLVDFYHEEVTKSRRKRDGD